MSEREIAVILLNLSLDMDYGDYFSEYGEGKRAVDALEEEITILKLQKASLYPVLKELACRKSDVTILVDGYSESCY